MKVLFLINGLGTGGAERSLAEMLPALAQAGWTPTIAVLHRRSEGVEAEVLESGTDVRFVQGSRLRQFVAVRRLIRTLSPDVIHTSIFESDVIGRLAAVRTGVPVVTTLVNTSYDPARLADPNIRRMRLRAVQAIDALTARHLTTHFIAITRAVKHAAVRDLGIEPARVTVIHRLRDPKRLGEPSERRRAAARANLGLSDSCFVVVNVGRQEFQKGQVDLVDAVAELRKECNVRLLIAGRSGAATGEITAAISERGVEDGVRLLGHVEDVAEVLAAADVFAFPSRYEGLGGALIEAMALGLPIVAADIPAVREVVEIGGNADVFLPNDVGALAKALGAMAHDLGRAAAYSTRSREIYELRFARPRRSGASIVDVFNVVVGAAGVRKRATPRTQ